MIYFDNAASSFPKPYSVIKNVSKWIERNGANPGRSGHKLSLDAASAVFDTRYVIASFFGVDEPEKIAFVPNATFGLNMLIQGLIHRGDHVITTELEHNSVLRPLHYMHVNHGIKYNIADVDLYDDKRTVDNILSLINPKTRFVICTHCSNVCGKVMPIRYISEKLPKNIKLIVDGSQGAGIIPLNMVKDGVDYYCAPSHKGLLGIQGSGFVAINSDMPKPVITGGTGSDSKSLSQPDHLPDAFESGTVATPAIVSMKYGLKYINEIGINNIYRHKKELVIYMYEKLKKLNKVKLYVDNNISECVGVMCFNIKDRTSDETADYLSSKGICVRSGLHCAPLAHKKFHTDDCGSVRVSFSYFNSFDEIDRMVEILNKY